MTGTGKIIGLPLKIFSNNNIYIPFEYLRFYGISEKKDRLRLDIQNHSLFYRPFRKGTDVATRSNTRSIKAGLTPLPVAWLRQNKLTAGDRVFLLGTTGGLFLYVRREA